MTGRSATGITETSGRGTAVRSGLESGLVEAMSQPSFYPHEPERVELIETHISWVFVAGDLVYKVKKPVVFPFLDYGTAERRRLLCHEEVRLNRRLAPDLYLGVRGLARGRDRWTLTDAEDVAASEHAVEMRRFDEERTLERHLERGGVDPAQIVALGRKVAAFHRAASPLPPERGGSAAQARLVNENFESLLSFEAVVPARALAAAQRFSSAFLSARGAQLDRRARAGLVRDGHGDLRAEHVLLMGGGIEVFDCIEFSSELRGIDTGSDLAFLVMDLEAHERADLARKLVAAYRVAGGDPGDDALVAYYGAYRAWVRAKVACLRAAELQDDDPKRRDAEAQASSFAALGRRFAWRARGSLLLVTCGGTASGKTYLASRLAQASGLTHLNSDAVRKEMLGLSPVERAPASAYTQGSNARTYAELGRQAADALGTDGAVVDATFRNLADRARFGEALGNAGVEPVFVECRAPREVLERRAADRMRSREHVSDAGPALVARQQLEFAPLDEVPAERHLVVRTDRPVESVVDDVEALLDARLCPGS